MRLTPSIVEISSRDFYLWVFLWIICCVTLDNIFVKLQFFWSYRILKQVKVVFLLFFVIHF